MMRKIVRISGTLRAGTPSAGRRSHLKSRDELERENEVLAERIATLSAAVLRLGSTLDLPTVLQEAADSARTLTRARYSLIVTIDEAAETREFVTSGLDPEGHRELAAWPDGPKLFAYQPPLRPPLAARPRPTHRSGRRCAARVREAARRSSPLRNLR